MTRGFSIWLLGLDSLLVGAALNKLVFHLNGFMPTSVARFSGRPEPTLPVLGDRFPALSSLWSVGDIMQAAGIAVMILGIALLLRKEVALRKQRIEGGTQVNG